MRGVVLKKAFVIAEDERRKIVSLMNGEVNVRDIHILFMKKGEQILGQHYHLYPEVCYMMKGKAHYKLRNELTKEEMELDVEEGDVMFRGPFVGHSCIASEDCIMIDGGGESWIDEQWNHYPDKLL